MKHASSNIPILLLQNVVILQYGILVITFLKMEGHCTRLSESLVLITRIFTISIWFISDLYTLSLGSVIICRIYKSDTNLMDVLYNLISSSQMIVTHLCSN